MQAAKHVCVCVYVCLCSCVCVHSAFAFSWHCNLPQRVHYQVGLASALVSLHLVVVLLRMQCIWVVARLPCCQSASLISIVILIFWLTINQQNAIHKMRLQCNWGFKPQHTPCSNALKRLLGMQQFMCTHTHTLTHTHAEQEQHTSKDKHTLHSSSSSLNSPRLN